MWHKAAFLVFFLLFLFAIANGVDHCDRKSLPDPLTLDPDQITVLISGYSPSRIPLLRSLAISYSSHPLVSKTLILWFNPDVSSNLLAPLSSLPSPISLHLSSSSSSLNSRFLPRRQILTRSVLIADDDVEVSPASLSFAFNIWRSNADSVVGFFARSHDLDLGSRSWIYTVHRDRYSIILTKAMVVRTEYLYRYSCGGGGEGFAEARRFVEKERNCEDILMNFLVAIESEGSRPVVLVEGKERVRDWGDPRNENNGNGDRDRDDGGLSSRGDHWKKRGDCIREFHRILGRMPLRYGYGKVVDGDGQQGMCRKGGRLVPCEQQL